MRALIIASVSRPMVMVPCSTSLTYCFTMSFPRSRAASSFPSRPSSTMLSRRPFSCVATVASAAAAFCASAIGASFDFCPQFFHLLFVLYRLEKDVVQLFIALQVPAQIGEFGAQLKQVVQRLDLARYRRRFEI